MEHSAVQDKEDQHWMQRALSLAKRGLYTTRPNPAVGCVLVKDGKVIGEGFHPKAGQPHAEVFALRAAGDLAVGATAYVTLEPCSHFGRTPPCANALIAAQVSRVVMATLDANPQVAGQGLARLEAAGIATRVGVCEAEARALNVGFLQTMAGQRPYVRLKVAASLDGRTAMSSGESKWITGSAARLDVQHYRAMSGAVITGIGTVLADDPLLNVRQVSDGTPLETIPQPLRVVIDRHQRMPSNAQILKDPDSVLMVTLNPEESKLKDSAECWQYQSLALLLDELKQKKQIHDVLVEAGATLSGAFIAAGLVDELIVYLAPTLLGSLARPMFDLPFLHMSEQIRWQTVSVTPVGDDLKWVLRSV
ncbi:bifunctional diaminohydroxyphosphoribosylaminopyrimidine deaminase/5-amino-6-(5-phosphoribosylamino)uracil reductase RibD [Aquirhabdus parva]|nr:bifunctional diaminohydroxyphosphoribosylaminopyrimidine deaminase/5-amino-6-(5-phosphoribosylamino)uracil reductase RibD [Aquirhabdus parva]